MDAMDQPRQPSGSPAGGQWAGTEHMDGDIDLAAPVPDDENTDTYHWHRVTASGLAEARARVDAANRRLERAGIEDRFTLHESEPQLAMVLGSPTNVYRVWLDQPSISYDGWEFIGKRTANADGSILVSRQDKWSHEIDDLPEEIVCEHCGRKQRRSSSYVVRDESSGTVMQVGSSCVNNFLGVRPEGLWSLDVDMWDDVEQVDDENRYTGPTRSKDEVYGTRDVIALALEVSDGGKSWVKSGGMGATVERVRHFLEQGWTQEEANGREDPRVDEVLAAMRKMEGESEYVRNLRVLADSPIVSRKFAGLAASAVTAWHRAVLAEERERNAPAPAAKGYAGEKGDRVKGRKAKITGIHEFESSDYYGDPITKRAVTFRDEDNHEMVWFTASGAELPEPGSSVEFTGGSVSAQRHNDRFDVDQTILSRVKVKPADSPPT